MDLVAHCGWSGAGQLLYTLSLVDVATGWVACAGLRDRRQETVFHWHTHLAGNQIPSANDFEPDGRPYSIASLQGSFYVAEPNSSQVDRVSLSGTAE